MTVLKNPFKRSKARVVIERPLRDEEALALVRNGVLRPHEAPMAMLRDLQRQAKT